MRRILCSAVAVSLCAALWVTAPALSRTPYVPSAEDFSMPIGGALARASSAIPVTSRVLRAPKRFDLVGFTYHSRATPRFSLRTRRDGGQWSGWMVVTAMDAGPDGNTGPLTTEPTWVGGADELQLRTGALPGGLTADFVNTTGSATPSSRLETTLRRLTHAAVAAVLGGPAAAQAQTQDGRPPIVPRSAWGADQCRPRTTPQYGTVKLAFVHHTDTANDYSAADAPAIVLAICRYHRDSNKWNDIGYNFLVDRFGTIYEGRAGGTERAVQGAHTQGFNSESTSVANIGTFQDVAQNDTALRAQARLLAWKLTLHGVPMTGKVKVLSSGGPLSRFPSGAVATLNRISGHRDGGPTDCPGNDLYGQLPHLRVLANRYAQAIAGLTLTADAPLVTFPSPALLSGRLGQIPGVSSAPASIGIQQFVAGSGWRTVQSVTTSSAGNWRASVPITRTTTLRARFAGDSERAGNISRSLAVVLRPALTARLSRNVVRAGGTVSLRGAMAPRRSRIEVVIERFTGGRIRFLGRQPVQVGDDGRYVAPIKLGLARRYRLSVRFVGDGSLASAQTSHLSVTGQPTRRPARR